MHQSVFRNLLPWAAALLFAFGGCGKDKSPRYTPTPIGGYPYPFGTDVKKLLGNDHWDADPGVRGCQCQHPYMNHWLRNPPQDSRWFDYSSVLVTADSAGTLQGFGATRSFATKKEAQTAILDLLGELQRRYGAPTDSAVVNRVLRRDWLDQAGNAVTVYDATSISAQWMFSTGSAKLRRECKGVSL
jgi:hypothetical protein